MAPFLWGHSFVFGGVNFCWSDLKLRFSFGKPGPPKPMPRHRKTNLFTNIQEYPTTLIKYNMAGEESLIKAKKKVDIYNILYIYTLYLLFWQFILIVSAFLGCFNLCVPPPKKKKKTREIGWVHDRSSGEARLAEWCLDESKAARQRCGMVLQSLAEVAAFRCRGELRTKVTWV